MKGSKRRGALRRTQGLILAGVLAPFPLSALADSVAQTTAPLELQTLTIEGNKLYDMPPSEETGGYTVKSATVGTKTPAALKDIPQSITSYTNDYIKDRKFVHLDDLAKYTAGLRVLTNDSGRSSIYSRGYEYDEYNIDGLPAPMTSIYGTVPSLAAYDRVEIMRGPAGLFSSTSELGGIVNMVRKRPTADFQGSVEASYGTFDTNHEQVDVSGPLDSQGRVRGRFIASRDDTNGQVDYNANTSETYYGALDIDLDDATQLSFGLNHEVKNITPNNGYPTDSKGNLLSFSHSKFFGADWNSFDGKTTDFTAELTHHFDDGGEGRVAMRTSHRDTHYLYAFTGAGVSSAGTTSLRATERDFEQDAFSMDASFSKPFEAMGNVSEFVVGTDYKNYHTSYLDGSKVIASSININTYEPTDYAKPADFYTTDNGSQSEEYGVYSKLTFRPIERLALIGGARLSYYKGSAYTTTLSSGAKASTDQTVAGRVTPYGGAVFDLNDNNSLYFSYSQVYKPQTYLDAAGKMLKPREGDQYEVGIKGSYFGGDLNTRVSVFQLTDKNRYEQVYNSSGVAVSNVYEAGGKTRVRGAEFEISGKLLPNWDLMAGYTYMDTKVLSGDTVTTFQTMPKNQASIWNKYTVTGGPVAGLEIGSGVTAMSDFYMTTASGTAAYTVAAPGYATVDAKLAYPITKKLTATLDATNLLNRDYYSRVGSAATFNFLGQSRALSVGARYEF